MLFHLFLLINHILQIKFVSYTMYYAIFIFKCSEVAAQGWFVKRYIFKNIFFTEHLRVTAFFIKLKKLIIDQILFWCKID